MTKERLQSPVIAVAVLLTCIGLFAFAAVVPRLVQPRLEAPDEDSPR